jgi:hypothetical protein
MNFLVIVHQIDGPGAGRQMTVQLRLARRRQ